MRTDNKDQQTKAELAESGLMSVPRGAAFLGLQPSTMRAWILKRKIDFVKLRGGRVFLRRADLEKLISESVIKAKVK